MNRAHEIERRVIPFAAAGIQLRRRRGGRFGIRGTAAVVGSLSEDLGGFVERNSKGAFDDAIRVSDIRGLFNHDPNFVLGRLGRTMSVTTDRRGMYYDIPELPESRADVREAIERRDVEGSSYSFTLREGGDRWDEEAGKLVRTILPGGIARVYDVGPVTFPAFRSTSVAERCFDMVRSAGSLEGRLAPRCRPLGSVVGLAEAVLRDEKGRRLSQARQLLEAAERRGRDLDGSELVEWRRLLDDVKAIGRELDGRRDGRIAADRAKRAAGARQRVSAASKNTVSLGRTHHVRRDPWY